MQRQLQDRVDEAHAGAAIDQAACKRNLGYAIELESKLSAAEAAMGNAQQAASSLSAQRDALIVQRDALQQALLSSAMNHMAAMDMNTALAATLADQALAHEAALTQPHTFN